MHKYIIRRILIALPILFGVTLLNFLIINLAPGSPVDLYVFESGLTAEQVQMKKELLGLNEPLWTQYLHWLGQLLQGNFGASFITHEPVLEMIGSRIGPTLLLMGTSLVIAYIIAIPIGIISATKQYSWVDYLTTTFSFLGPSIPNFFLGLGAIYVFAVVLQIFPIGGMHTLGQAGSLGDTLMHVLLPALVLGTAAAGSMVRYVRSSMLDVLGKDYLRTARAKGLREFVVTYKHALRNALIPILTIIGLEIPSLIGGAIVTEQIFQWPGLGQLTIQSIGSRDYSTLMAINFVAAIAVILSSLITDILYSVFDPRIKLQ